MQFKVPQNVEREDHIIGPVTMKQMIICTVGGGMAYSVYVFLAQRYTMEIWLPPTAFLALLTIAIAFVKVNNIPFTKWVLLLVEFFLTANRRVWTKGADRITLIELPQTGKVAVAVGSKSYDHKTVRKLVQVLEKADYSHLADSQMKEIAAEKENTEYAEKLAKMPISPKPIVVAKKQVQPPVQIKAPNPTQTKASAQTPAVAQTKPIAPAPQKTETKIQTPPPQRPKVPMKVIISKGAQRDKKPNIISPQFQKIKSATPNKTAIMPNTNTPAPVTPTPTELATTQTELAPVAKPTTQAIPATEKSAPAPAPASVAAPAVTPVAKPTFVEKTKATVQKVKDKTVQTTEYVQEKTKQAKTAIDKTKETAQKVKDTAIKTKEAVTTGATKAKETAVNTKNAVTEGGHRTKDFFTKTKDNFKAIFAKDDQTKNEINAQDLKKGGEIKF